MPRDGYHRIAAGSTFVSAYVRRGRALLVGSATPALLARAGIRPDQVEWVLLASHERDLCEGAPVLAAAGATVAAPAGDADLISHAGNWWNQDGFRNHVYNFHPWTRMPREAVPVGRRLADGATLEWRGLQVLCVATPGAQPNGCSFLVRDGGRTRAHIGDLLDGPGRFHDWHSLQGSRPIPGGGNTMEYHGYGERAETTVASLRKLAAMGVSELVPARGPVMEDPPGLAAGLGRQVAELMACYCSTSASRWYFAGVRPEWPADITPLRARQRPVPAWVIQLGGTSRLLVAPSGRSLLIDCDGEVPQLVAKLIADGTIRGVDALWITHYHDDHVGQVVAITQQTGCPVIAHHTMADLLQRPDAYHLSAVCPDPLKLARITHDGESWDWEGFRLTAHDFPGQTCYDAALLVERAGDRVLFLGDSMTPGGFDDYCVPNRNFTRPGTGYDRCMEVLDAMGPVVCVNQHIAGGFVFSHDEIQAMRSGLADRRRRLSQLVSGGEPDHALDLLWVRADPYFQQVQAGAQVRWKMRFLNHFGARRTVRVEMRAPSGWPGQPATATLIAQSGKEAVSEITLQAPMEPGRYVFGLSVSLSGKPQGEPAEAVVEVVGR